MYPTNSIRLMFFQNVQLKLISSLSDPGEAQRCLDHAERIV